MNEKTLVFDNGGAMDGNLVAALMNGNNRNNGYGNGYGWEWMWMILLWALWGGNGWGGFGGRGNGLSNLPAELNGDAGRQLLMNAIQGNGTAINQLASSLNCSVQQIQTALCNIQAQSGLSAQQIINAVQSGNAQVLSQMASCCCDVRTAIERQGYESQLATLNQTNTLTSNANTQFNALGSKIDAQTQVINDRFCALEMREMQNKLDAERAKSAALAGQLSQEHQTATIMQSQAQAVAPINAAIGDLSNRLAKIECGLPPTTGWASVPRSDSAATADSGVNTERRYAMAVFPFQYVNRRGIPVIKTTGVTVNAADVVFSFQNHAFANSWYRGIVLVELSQAIPAGTTGTLPVLFETNGVTKNVTTYNGANVTVSDIPGTGVFQLFYDKQTDTLQLMTGAV